jgi:hypothetical protein
VRVEPSAAPDRGRRPGRLDQVPTVAVAILEHHHRAVRLPAWLFGEPHAGGGTTGIGGGEVDGVEEQEHPAAALIADRGALPLTLRPGQQQCRSASRGLHHHPPLGGAEHGVLHQHEAEAVDVVSEGGVVVVDQQRQLRQAHQPARSATVWNACAG